MKRLKNPQNKFLVVYVFDTLLLLKFIQSSKENGKAHSESKTKPKSADQMNMKGVFLHVLADALGSVVVIISALIIWLTDWQYRDYVDPALSVAMVCLIMWSTWPLRKLYYTTA